VSVKGRGEHGARRLDVARGSDAGTPQDSGDCDIRVEVAGISLSRILGAKSLDRTTLSRGLVAAEEPHARLRGEGSEAKILAWRSPTHAM